MTNTKPLPFDGNVPWSDITLEPGYDLEIQPADGGMQPTIVIEPHTNELTYYFPQAFDDKASFTPGYVLASEPLTNQLLDTGLYGIPDELPVETWMPAAIERAGFNYDPEPNSEKHDRNRERGPFTHPDQTALGEL